MTGGSRGPTDLTRESDVQYACKRLLEATGWWCYALSQGRRTRQSAGLPDLYALHPQHGALWLECKQARGAQSPAQVKFQERCVQAQVPYVVARSVAELEAYLRLQKLVG